jgi:mannose-1-phosphate guanylyltransferase
MLEHTVDRAEKIIPSDRLFTVVSRAHLRYPEVWRQLRSRPKGTLVVQPENKETEPGLFLPLKWVRFRRS